MSSLPGVDGSKLTGIVHVSESNPDGILYTRGDANTESSLRIIASDPLTHRFESMTAGVWNLTTIQAAPATVLIGINTSLSAAGEWLETKAINEDTDALIPHIPFDDDGTGLTVTPILGAKVTEFPIQPDNSSEVTGKDLQQVTINPSSLLLSKIYYQVGSIGSTEPIQVIFRRGVDTSAPIFSEMNFPTSFMSVPESQIEVDLLGRISGIPGEPIHTQFLSDSPISLKANLSGEFFALADFQPLAQEEIILDNLILANDASLVFQTDGGFVTNDTFATAPVVTF